MAEIKKLDIEFLSETCIILEEGSRNEKIGRMKKEDIGKWREEGFLTLNGGVPVKGEASKHGAAIQEQRSP